MSANSTTVTTMSFSPAFADVLGDWDTAIWELARTVRQAHDMTAVLVNADMGICAKAARRIRDDLGVQMRTGEVIARLSAKFVARHPLLTQPIEAELFRQFTVVAVEFHTLGFDTATPSEIYATHIEGMHGAFVAAINAAHTTTEEN